MTRHEQATIPVMFHRAEHRTQPIERRMAVRIASWHARAFPVLVVVVAMGAAAAGALVMWWAATLAVGP